MLDRPLPFLRSHQGQGNELHKLLAPLLAGSLARTAVATAFSPIELLRTRLQSLPSTASSSAVVASIRDVVRSQGFLSLWRGLPATLWRDVPFSGLYWLSYEVMSRTLTGSGFGESAVEPEKGGRAFAVAFVSGAVSGSVRPALHPFISNHA